MNQSKFWVNIVSLLISLLGTLPAIAQTSPGYQFPNPILPTPLPSPQLPFPQPPSPLKVPPSLAPSAPEVPTGLSGTFTVRQFKFEGSKAFSTNQLQEAVAPFTGHPITLKELKQALDAINMLYLKAGYLTSGIRIPGSLNRQRQSSSNVVFTIRVIEAQVEQINVLGSARLQSYVRARLERAASPALNEERLLDAIRFLQRDPLIKTISAELLPGSQQGQWIVGVRITPRPPLSVQVGLDNNRSPAVGSLQRRVSFSDNNLLGRGDRLRLGYFNTQGSNAGTASYTLPYNTSNGTLQFATSILASRIIENPFNQIDLLSNFRSYELTVRQPLSRTATQQSTQEFALGLTASRQESEASLLGVPFPLSAGADAQGRTRISAVRFFQEYSRQSNKQTLALRSQLSAGLNLGSTINPQPPDSRFFSWRGEGQYARLMARDTPLLVGFGVQASDRSLVPIEQLSLGGPDTVRGYRKDLLLANSGAFASIETRFPILRSSRLPGLLQVAPFFDFGTSFDGKQGFNLNQHHTLASVGVGLRWQVANELFMRLDYGIPLVSVPAQGDSLQAQGVSFAVYYNPL
ncbi:hypothetical protein AVDCRST_MAG94-3013 [uncultured Leptolyngbya sp.]|uniref:Hemolysin activation/secretion protein n=1 Tax=uncultured Leptolyngbya sp. TaxID=332963 RepID=A0A6J4MAE8_9CYAN|nr:hypothetical protein AVDCRST_MAG94-3013 [uncultured Leptolyngbya sp.]